MSFGKCRKSYRNSEILGFLDIVSRFRSRLMRMSTMRPGSWEAETTNDFPSDTLPAYDLSAVRFRKSYRKVSESFGKWVFGKFRKLIFRKAFITNAIVVTLSCGKAVSQVQVSHWLTWFENPIAFRQPGRWEIKFRKISETFGKFPKLSESRRNFRIFPCGKKHIATDVTAT